MRFLQAAEFREQKPNEVRIQIDNHHHLFVQSLEHDLWRVFLKKKGKFRLDRTWSICPRATDLPYAGRERSSSKGFTCPPLQVSQTREIQLVGEGIKLSISQKPLSLKFSSEGIEFLKDRPTGGIALGIETNEIQHFVQRDETDIFFGLGEKTGDLFRNNQRYQMKNLDPLGYDPRATDPLYKHYPVYFCRKQQGLYYFCFYDNLSTSQFDFGKERDNYHGSYSSYSAEDGDFDLYVGVSKSLQAVVQRFTSLTGRAPLPPSKAFDYMGSGFQYTEAEDAQNRLKEFMKNAGKHNLHPSSFQLSSGYTADEKSKKRFVFEWNKNRFPDFKDLAALAKSEGMTFTANVKPAMHTEHPRYQEAKKNALFIKDGSGHQPQKSMFWDGEASHLDFTNPRARDWWTKNLKKHLLDEGVQGLWNDNNEYEIWERDAECFGEGRKIPIGLIRPIQAMLMTKTSRDALVEASPTKRPFTISRCGSPGIQRYAQSWSGDNYTSWDALRYGQDTLLSTALCGLSFYGNDIGGFAGPKPDPELLLRWIQAGVFYPRFCIHSWNDDGSSTEAWMYPEILDHVKKAIALREKLKPYLYTLAYRYHRFYEPICRPCFFDFQDDLECWKIRGQFMFGSEILAAPVYEARAMSKAVYLPKTNYGWYDGMTMEYHPGGKTIQKSITQDSIPFFVRAGSLIPHQVNDQIVLTYYKTPRTSRSRFSVYMDDGDSRLYETKDFSFLQGDVEQAANTLNIEYNREGLRTPKDIGFQLPESFSLKLNRIAVKPDQYKKMDLV